MKISFEKQTMEICEDNRGKLERGVLSKGLLDSLET